MALKIDIAANTTAAQAQVKDLSKSLDAVADSLDDLASDAKRSGSKLENAAEDMGDSLKDVAKEGDRAADKLEDSFRDMVRDAKRAGDDAGDGLGDGMKKGFKKAEEGAEEFKDEANSTAREAAASFDGSAESIADMFQEVAANAFAGFGPAGAAAGLLAAAGIGLAVAGFEDVNEASEESKQRAADWAQAFVEAGSTVASSAQVAAGMIEIATDPEKYEAAKQNAKNWGVDVSTAMRAMAGDATALRIAEEELTEKGERYNDLQSKTTEQAIQMRQEWENGTNALSQINSEMDEGADAARNVSDGLIDMVNSASAAIVEVDEVGNTLYTLPDGVEVVVDAKTGLAHQNIDKFKGDVDGVPEVVTTTVKVRVDSRDWDNWRPTIKHGGVQAYVRNGRTLSLE